MPKPKKPNLLRYNNRKERAHSGTLLNHYLTERKSKELPLRCDIPECRFHKDELIWNGKLLPLTLDHTNGVNTDDRYKNLRLLCPACHSQQETSGGKNKGRVEKAEGGFAIVDKSTQLRRYVLPAQSADVDIEIDQPTFRFGGAGAHFVEEKYRPKRVGSKR